MQEREYRKFRFTRFAACDRGHQLDDQTDAKDEAGSVDIGERAGVNAIFLQEVRYMQSGGDAQTLSAPSVKEAAHNKQPQVGVASHGKGANDGSRVAGRRDELEQSNRICDQNSLDRNHHRSWNGPSLRPN